VIKKIILLLLVVVAAVFVRNSQYADMLTIESLKANSDAIHSFVAGHFAVSALIFLIAYIAIAALNIPGAAVMSLGGGYIFGALAGTFLAVTGATIGAGLSFLMSRYIIGKSLNVKYAKQLARFNKELESNGYFYMLTLRLIPIFPFFLINILAGLTKMNLTTFLWTTYLGMIPGGFVYVYSGSRLNEVTSIRDIFSAGMLSAFALFGLLMLVPVIYKKIKDRR